jgi:hypothetical protein
MKGVSGRSAPDNPGLGENGSMSLWELDLDLHEVTGVNAHLDHDLEPSWAEIPNDACGHGSFTEQAAEGCNQDSIGLSSLAHRINPLARGLHKRLVSKASCKAPGVSSRSGLPPLFSPKSKKFPPTPNSGGS